MKAFISLKWMWSSFNKFLKIVAPLDQTESQLCWSFAYELWSKDAIFSSGTYLMNFRFEKH